ncbi:MAG: LysM peptidoglycan-binding domain-containing protein [Bacteroidales bacterium]
MRYKITFILFISILTGTLQSVANNSINYSSQQLLTDTINHDESPELLDKVLSNSLDSIISSWMYAGKIKYDSSCTSRRSHCPSLPDTTYMNRLEKITTLIELPYNNVIKKYIEYYTGPRRKFVEQVLGLSQYYFPMIEQIFDAHGIPLELKYLAIVESALNPSALSKQGASGLWQFMLPTGKHFGLEISTLVDERRNPYQSTLAAAKYLKSLYNIYNDWTLAIAAYNCGPGNVNKAIKRTSGKKDYWAIYYNLPQGTREYMPLFIAINYIMKYHLEHEICPSVCPIALDMDTVKINKTVHFNQIAKVTGLSVGELRAYNPQFKRDIIPGTQRTHTLRLPMAAMMAYVEQEDVILNTSGTSHLRQTVEIGAKATGTAAASAIPDGEYILHTIRSGETLGGIASKYKVKVTDLRKWNNVANNNIRAGKKLKVYGKSAASQNQASGESKAPNTTADVNSFKQYKVKSGDSFWNIAREHKTSVQKIMDINNMSKSSKLMPGQTIRVPQS